MPGPPATPFIWSLWLWVSVSSAAVCVLGVCLWEWCFHDLCGGFHFISLPLAFLFFLPLWNHLLMPLRIGCVRSLAVPLGHVACTKIHMISVSIGLQPLFCPFPLSILGFFSPFFLELGTRLVHVWAHTIISIHCSFLSLQSFEHKRRRLLWIDTNLSWRYEAEAAKKKKNNKIKLRC